MQRFIQFRLHHEASAREGRRDPARNVLPIGVLHARPTGHTNPRLEDEHDGAALAPPESAPRAIAIQIPDQIVRNTLLAIIEGWLTLNPAKHVHLGSIISPSLKSPSSASATSKRVSSAPPLGLVSPGNADC